MNTDNKNWWQAFFNEDFSAVLLDRENDPSLVPTADFLVSALDLRPGDKVFDQCCGTGAVSRALANKGLHVTGIDQAEYYIQRAQDLANELDLKFSFFQVADAFDYVTPEKQDAAINWYSSFGYTPDDTQNIKMLERVFESLKPGGRFAIDYMNVPNLLANFQPVYTRTSEIQGQKITFEKHTTIDQKRGMIGQNGAINSLMAA